MAGGAIYTTEQLESLVFLLEEEAKCLNTGPTNVALEEFQTNKEVARHLAILTNGSEKYQTPKKKLVIIGDVMFDRFTNYNLHAMMTLIENLRKAGRSDGEDKVVFILGNHDVYDQLTVRCQPDFGKRAVDLFYLPTTLHHDKKKQMLPTTQAQFNAFVTDNFCKCHLDGNRLYIHNGLKVVDNKLFTAFGCYDVYDSKCHKKPIEKLVAEITATTQEQTDAYVQTYSDPEKYFRFLKDNKLTDGNQPDLTSFRPEGTGEFAILYPDIFVVQGHNGCFDDKHPNCIVTNARQAGLFTPYACIV